LAVDSHNAKALACPRFCRVYVALLTSERFGTSEYDDTASIKYR
jgi:hypothetical protein